jgi:hypothetical protein
MKELKLDIHGTEKGRQELDIRPPAVLVFLGRLVSFIFHPLLIPAYITFFLIYIHPYAFAGMIEQLKMYRLVSVFFSTAFLPAFSVFLMKQLGFVKTVFLRTRQDRIIPYIVSMIFYFWAWYVSRNVHDNPALVAMLLSTFIASIAALMCNIFFKISMHGIAAGAFFIFFLWLAFTASIPFPFNLYLCIAMLAAGLVCTARLLVSDHSEFEVYAGLAIGAVCQLVAIGIAA